MPDQDAAKPGGAACAAGTVKFEATPVTGSRGRSAYPAQFRLATVASRVGRISPGWAGTMWPIRTGRGGASGAAVAIVAATANGNVAAAKTARVRRCMWAYLTCDWQTRRMTNDEAPEKVSRKHPGSSHRCVERSEERIDLAW